MAERKYLTVTALNRYLKYKFDHDENLQTILLKAEISNFKRHSRGHLYLTLKDDTSQISAVMFQGNTRSLHFEPKDGDKVIVEGHISVYEPYGTYQVYINKLDLDGIGDLYLAYEQLKQDLQKQGLFEESHKVKLPQYPKVVGVITSPTGAAVRDIINVVSIRYPLAKIIVYPALVQGTDAKVSISKQINQANQDGYADVLIVGRGGGSIEDLWGFNEEIVARAIYASKIPLISAVGHETDFTIADFVADVRASTPSHAAELAVPSKTDIIKYLKNAMTRISVSLKQANERSIKHYLQVVSNVTFQRPEKITESKHLALLYLEDKLNAYKPQKRIEHLKESILQYRMRINQIEKSILKEKQSRFLVTTQKLDLVNPLNIMQKGFTIVKQQDTIRKSVKEVDETQSLTVQFHDGELDCSIIRKVKKQ
ncbi:MAG: exodeoxyribonuclease VII large subunit [Bacilli bacterium]|nr:exodeoxyribonuclease VII large subunit [Bacilli bacterium]MBN2877400.1 exodeoxyribonuclease VII large subunit [Bacilli bacterium]